MAIGDTSAVPQDLDQAMKASSLTHLTAVSGAHVAIVLGAILAVSAALRIPRGGRALVGAVGLIGFAALVGPAPSVLRSALMGGAIVLGLALGRGRAALGALGGSVLCLIVADPWMSREYGFALSVAATAGLIVVAPRWQRWLARYLPKALAAAIAVPAAAQAACAPIIAAFAGQVSLIGVLANAAAAPAVPLATASGVAGCLLGPLGGWPADAALRLAAVGTGWIARVARWGAALPGAVLPWPTGASGAAGLAVATVIGVALVGVAARTRRRRQALAVATICAVLIAWTPLGANTRRAVSALTQTGWARDWAVAVCDVGQGAAVAIRAGPSSAVLVDAGPARGGADTCLDALGIDNLAAVVLTHLHADHVGGLGAAIQGRAPGTILAPVDCGQGAAQTDLRQAARDARIVQVSSRDRAGLPVEGSAQEIAFEVFPSDLDARCRSDGPARTGEDSVVNDASLTVHATVRGVDVWVLGDLELSGQAALARALPNSRIERGKVSVTVVAHHGSAKQDERLAAALAPDIAAFSAGIDNDYGHPTQTALDLYAEVGAAIVRTDRDGHLAVRADGTVWGSRANGPSG
jgi:competence protein ComEC